MTRVAFTHHVLHMESRQLFRESVAVHLSPKGMDLLLILVNARDRYLSKNELQRALWPGLSVGSSSLPGLVKELRRALGDTLDEPSVLRTLHGRGYQFVAPVTILEERVPERLRVQQGILDADTAISLPPDFAIDTSDLAIVTLWPPGGMTLVLAAGPASFSLGRAEQCELFLPYEKVSRRHAEIARRGPALVLRDLGSTNGSFVDGERVREGSVLKRGQLIRLGEWLGLLTSAADAGIPARLRQLLGARDWSGRMRELEAACAEVLSRFVDAPLATRRP